MGLQGSAKILSLDPTELGLLSPLRHTSPLSFSKNSLSEEEAAELLYDPHIQRLHVTVLEVGAILEAATNLFDSSGIYFKHMLQ